MKAERGAPDLYELVWESGHTEKIAAHQVAWPNALHGGRRRPRVLFHAEIDGRWTLLLSVFEDDIRTIRNITRGEQIPGGES
ncbi:hypothetical protein ADK70_12775 [Streptomyces rimosus subsp. pseudoverticillatus]|nr:hypothetical protein ADK70_12775 [Streptomyces rimosus subsp. pseudoverticillatus]